MGLFLAMMCLNKNKLLLDESKGAKIKYILDFSFAEGHANTIKNVLA